MSNFKKLVEVRMAKTGESWSTAARNVRAQRATRPTKSTHVSTPASEENANIGGTAAPARTISVSVDGTPGPTRFFGQCPSCKAPVKGVLFPSRQTATLVCGGAGRLLPSTVTRAPLLLRMFRASQRRSRSPVSSVKPRKICGCETLRRVRSFARTTIRRASSTSRTTLDTGALHMRSTPSAHVTTVR